MRRPFPPGQARFVGSFPSLETLPPATLPELAFGGRSNVGKSSAINALLGQALARTSRTPGRTQALNLIEVPGRLTLVDLPGYGYARVPEAVRLSWKTLIEGYLLGRQALRALVVVVDASLPAQALDRELLTGLRGVALPRVVVATRVDRLGRAARLPALRALARDLSVPELIPFSARTQEGVEAVWARLSSLLAGG